jgi:putative ABC transport system permease protein
MVLGFVVVTIFTFLPIYQLQGFKPRYIFRKEPGEISRDGVFYASQAMILLFLTAMTYRYLGNMERTAYFSIGIVVLVLVITLLANVVLRLLHKTKIAALDIRQALRGLFRPRNATAGIIVTLAAALTVLFSIYLIERNLDASFVQAYPEDAPNLVILDIQPDQRDRIREVLGAGTEFTPLIFARMQRINSAEVIREGDDQPESNRGPNPDGPPRLDDLFALTYRDSLGPDETLIEGETMFSAKELGFAQVSISEELLETYPFELGDRIEFEIQGVPFVAQLTSIRSTRNAGSGFGPPDFIFVFREKDLINAPQTIVTTATIPDEEIPQFQNQLVASFPNLTVIDIRATISTLAKLVADITTIIRFFTAFSIVAGVLIIISSVLATRFARIQESVYYKILGARRKFVLRVFALENVFIGLVSAILALLLSQVASWLLVTQVFELAYTTYWGSSIVLMAFTVALVTSVGLLASISILQKKPITFLRDQSIE